MNYVPHHQIAKCKSTVQHTLCTLVLLGTFGLIFTTPSAAAMRLGMEVNTAFTDVAVAVEYETSNGTLLRAVTPVNGEGIKLTWRSLAANNGFAFYAGPEVLTATASQNITGFAGYGFSYELGPGPARLALHASIGLADGPALVNSDAYVVPIGTNNLRLTNIAGLSISVSF